MTRPLEVVSDYCCYFSNRIAKFSNQIANRIAIFQIKFFHLKSNHQNGSNRDLNPNRDCYLPITVRSTFEGPPVWLIGSAAEDSL